MCFYALTSNTDDHPRNHAIIAEMEEVVGKSWYIVMRSTGVTERDCDLLKGAFVYPGFKQNRS